MKSKRVISLLISLLLIVNLLLPAMASTLQFGQTQNSYSISCDGKTVSVKAEDTYQNGYLLARLLGQTGSIATQTVASAKNTLTLSTAGLANGIYYLELYTGSAANGTYTGYASGTNTFQIQVSSGYASQVISEVWVQNIKRFSDARTDAFALQYYTAPSGYKVLKSLAASLTKNCKTQLEKIKAIHDWVSANLYYDYTTPNSKSDVVSAYKKRYTDAEGYANLTAALLRDAGIPAKVISGLAQSGDNALTTDPTTGDSHHWNEAYDTDSKRWIILDTCWDSSNRYENGQLITEEPWYRYFDPTLEAFSIDHLLQNNEDTKGLKAAFDEAVKSVQIDYSRTVIYTGEHNHTAQITVTLPEEYEGLSVKYGTTNKNKVSVSKKGVLTGTGYGKVNITVKVTDGTNSYSEKEVVRCYNPFLKYKKSVSSLKVGKSYTFSISKYGVTGTTKWSVSNTSVASVNSKGKLTAKKSGTVTVTATVNGVSVSKKVKITK